MRKKRVIKAIAIVLLLALVAGVVIVNKYKKEQEAIRVEQQLKEQKEKEKQRILGDTYARQNSAFRNSSDRTIGETIDGYIPYGKKVDEVRLMIAIHVYEKETGNVVTFEDIKEYLSTATEPDGSLRLYNNGLHPKIQEYVEWEGANKYKVTDYTTLLIRWIGEEGYDNPYNSFKNRNWDEITLQEMQELIKKVDDPEYVMQFDKT